MARLGAFCFPGSGHINPMAALAHALERRGHTVVIFGIADVESRVRAAGVEFHQIGAADYPLGTLKALDERLGELHGLASFHFTVERVKNTARMILRDGPAAVRAAGVDALLVDEADMGGTVAEHLRLPFISIAMFPPLIQSNRIPPFCFNWPAGQDIVSRLRNQGGMRLLSWIAAPIFNLVNAQRKEWGLKRLARSTDALSRLAQIAQLPEALEFDYSPRPEILHYTGPFVNPSRRPPVEFPWKRLDSRPLVYASLGTLQNGSESAFRTIAEACCELPVQLVISLGGGLEPARLGVLPGNPVVVAYAPQLELLKHAAAVITHAGLNTVLESLAKGVPLVAVPIGNDQPGVAARVKARGAGVAIPFRKLNPAQLRLAVRRVIEDPSYRSSAQELSLRIGQIDGPAMAAGIIERTLKLAGG